MKKIICILFILSFSITHVFAGGANLQAYEDNLLSFPAGYVVQEKIDPIIDSMSTVQLTTLKNKIQNYIQQYSEDDFYRSVFEYINIRATYQLNYIDLEGSPKSTESVSTLKCPVAITYQYQSGLSDGWVIPNICDTSLPDGIYRGKNHENGQVAREIPISDGRYHGDAVWYYENGQIQAEGSYDYGIIVGEYYWYTQDGRVSQKNIYSAGNVVEVFTYHFTGELSSNYSTKNGKDNSVILSYYSNGNKLGYAPFDEGVPVSTHTYWYKNGEVQTFIPVDDLTKDTFDLPDREIQQEDSVLYFSTTYDHDSGDFIAYTYLEVELSPNTILPRVYEEMLGMKSGESKTIIVPSEEGFQLYDENHIFAGMNLRYEITIYEIERPIK